MSMRQDFKKIQNQDMEDRVVGRTSRKHYLNAAIKLELDAIKILKHRQSNLSKKRAELRALERDLGSKIVIKEWKINSYKKSLENREEKQDATN